MYAEYISAYINQKITIYRAVKNTVGFSPTYRPTPNVKGCQPVGRAWEMVKPENSQGIVGQRNPVANENIY